MACKQFVFLLLSYGQVIGQQRYNKSVDWYALGVLVFEMLSGLPPYHQPDANPVALYEKITRGPAFIKWPAAFNQLATDLILRLMEPDPSKRFGNMQVDWKRLENREITAPYLPKISGDGDASAYVSHIVEYLAVADVCNLVLTVIRKTMQLNNTGYQYQIYLEAISPTLTIRESFES
jgi:serine/threonine protein kinase